MQVDTKLIRNGAAYSWFGKEIEERKQNGVINNKLKYDLRAINT